MKVPADITADRLMLEYLTRVAAAGTRYLPKGDRIAFVSKTRRRIERECGTGLGDPECMRGVLARLGEPEQLAMAERARIDAARIRRNAPDAETGAAAESVTTPLRHRRLNSRWRPATHAWPVRQPGGADAGQGGPPGAGGRPARDGSVRGRLAALLGEWPGARRGTPTRGGPAGPSAGRSPSAGRGPSAGTGPPAGTSPYRGTSTYGETAAAAEQPSAGDSQRIPPASPTSAGAAAAAAPVAGAGQVPGAPPAGPSAPATSGEPLEGKVLPPTWRAGRAGPGEPVGSGKAAHAAGPPPDWRAAPVLVPSRPVARRGTAATALATVGHAATQLASAGMAAARRYPLEATAVILLGLGGLILPFPFWLAGATVTIWSRIWDPVDKWVAFLGPLVFALVGSIVTTMVIHAEGNVVLIYSHAVRMDIGYLLRAGSVLCAVFLAMRIRHGPRERVPPWRR
jgi:hypothetical protein